MESTIVPARSLKPAQRAEAFKAAANEIHSLVESANQSRDAAIVAIHSACDTRLRVGVRLLDLKEQFAGEFNEWLEGYCSQWFSPASAFRWMAKVRDLKLALGKAEPTFEELKKAQLAAETLPQPWSEQTQGTRPAPFFRITIGATPPEEWDPIARREFLEEAKIVVALYERVRAIEEGK